MDQEIGLARSDELAQNCRTNGDLARGEESGTVHVDDRVLLEQLVEQVSTRPKMPEELYATVL